MLEAKLGTLGLWIQNQGICQAGAGTRARKLTVAGRAPSDYPVGKKRSAPGAITRPPLFPQSSSSSSRTSWLMGAEGAGSTAATAEVALPLLHGRSGLLLPYRTPIHTVGEPWPLPRGSMLPISGCEGCWLGPEILAPSRAPTFPPPHPQAGL